MTDDDIRKNLPQLLEEMRDRCHETGEAWERRLLSITIAHLKQQGTLVDEWNVDSQTLAEAMTTDIGNIVRIFKP